MWELRNVRPLCNFNGDYLTDSRMQKKNPNSFEFDKRFYQLIAGNWKYLNCSFDECPVSAYRVCSPELNTNQISGCLFLTASFGLVTNVFVFVKVSKQQIVRAHKSFSFVRNSIFPRKPGRRHFICNLFYYFCFCLFEHFMREKIDKRPLQEMTIFICNSHNFLFVFHCRLPNPFVLL